jgi:hypothetical protein
LPLLFNFALEYAIRKVQENKLGLKLNGTHQLLAYADFSSLGANIHIIRKNTGTLIVASKEFCLEVNTGKIKYMLLSHHQHARKSHAHNFSSRNNYLSKNSHHMSMCW